MSPINDIVRKFAEDLAKEGLTGELHIGNNDLFKAMGGGERTGPGMLAGNFVVQIHPTPELS